MFIYNMSVINKTSKGFFWALIDRGGLLIFQFLALVYLSRLVTPYDFGLVAILAVFINVSNVIIDSGMVGSLIKKQNIRKIDYYTLFAYNFGLSIIIYSILFFLAPFVAEFYEIPILEILIKILSISIVINSFGLVQLVRLNRALKFKIQSIITVISQILSVSISIYMAIDGYGVWALVALQLLHIFFNTLMLCFVNRFRPRIKFSISSFREQFNFGGPLLISNLLFIINNNIYSSVIGKYFTAIESGYFFQSFKLQNTPIGILSAVVDKVGFTVLSNEKNNRELILSGHKIYKYIYLITIPLFVYVAFVAEDLFLFIFDEKWAPASVIFKILCLGIIPLTVKILSRNLLKSAGKTKIILMIEFVTSIFGLSILYFSIQNGLEGIAYGLLISNIIISILSLVIVNKVLNYNYVDQLGIIIRPLLQSILVLFFGVYFLSIFDFSPIKIKIINGFIYIGLMFIFNIKLIKNYLRKEYK